jgi:signal transduction protein with GAF and PtsI domain
MPKSWQGDLGQPPAPDANPTAGDHLPPTGLISQIRARSFITVHRVAGITIFGVRQQSVRGFTNRDLRSHLAPLLGLLPGAITAGQATYDLRRLRTHGLIQRIPHSNRYLPTEDGLRAAIILTQTHARLLSPALAAANDPLADFPRLHRAVDNVRAALDDYAKRK